MKFNKLKTPCKDCPFRNDRGHPFFGRDQHGEARVRELAESFTENHVFPCHKTADWETDDETGYTRQVQNERTTACAGMVIMSEHDPRGSNLLRIMGRMGEYDPSAMNMDAPVYHGYQAMIEDHTPHEG